VELLIRMATWLVRALAYVLLLGLLLWILGTLISSLGGYLS
jgi:hypothetical protein